MSRFCVVAGEEFIQNTAGGGNVFYANLLMLSLLQKKVMVFFVARKKMISLEYSTEQLQQQQPPIQKWQLPLRGGRFVKLGIKILLFLYLTVRFKWLIVEHFYALPSMNYAPRFVFRKLIYSQHDFLFKVKALRDQTDKTSLKEVELKTIKQCKAAFAGNAKEAEFMNKQLGVSSIYLPIHTTKQPTTMEDFDYSQTIYHLGSFKTTASKLGFEHYKQNILPLLDKSKLTLKLIGGSTEQFSSIDDHVEGLGFVDDLSSLLWLGSIQIIPWRYDSGQRTRVFEAIARGNVMISFKVLKEIIPELEHKKNCMLVNTDQEFASAIERLLDDQELRKKLAIGALALNNCFSLETRVQKFKEFVEYLEK